MTSILHIPPQVHSIMMNLHVHQMDLNFFSKDQWRGQDPVNKDATQITMVEIYKIRKAHLK